MRHQSTIYFCLVSGLILGGLNLYAGTLIDEDFQAPMYTSGTQDPSFTNWTLSAKSARNDVTSVVPGENYPSFINQVIHFDVNNSSLEYRNTGHGWASNEAFTISLNASSSGYGDPVAKYIVVSLAETNGTVLWTDTFQLPAYDNFGRSDWLPDNTFERVVWASQFTTGSVGQEVMLHITHSGQRGLYVDNVFMEVGPAPVDNTPPAPDPITWQAAPGPGDYGYVTMIATQAIDTADVEYLFTNVTRGTSSGWIDNRVWNESGLEHGTLYTYQVKARDKSPNQNETAWSTPTNVTTLTAPPGTIVITVFECPRYIDGTQPAAFAGWQFSSSRLRNNVGSTDVPGDNYPAQTNQVIQFEYFGETASYDTDYAWDQNDIFHLSVNASPQAWSGSDQRYLELKLMQIDNTVLWATNAAIPLYNAFGQNPWTTNLTYEFDIFAKSFTNGAEGALLRLKLDSSGITRGIYIDNIHLAAEPPRGTLITLE
jgi:hypothetical protein